MPQPGYVKPFDTCSLSDVETVGGKCASLGELTKAGLRVPPGFAVTVASFHEFMAQSGLHDKVAAVVEDEYRRAHGDGGVRYHELSERIAQVFRGVQVPQTVKESIVSSYRELCRSCGTDEALVAVRSSATSEDSEQASFAGQHETFLNVCGEDEVVEKTVDCWRSLYSAAALHYRTGVELGQMESSMGVAVQKMVDAEVSGVIFTVNPISGDSGQMVVEMAWGLGEGVVGGYVAPDNYLIDKATLEIQDRMISPKMVEFVRDLENGGTVMREVEQARQTIPCMTDDEIRELAQMARDIEVYYGKPMDIEWALDAQLPMPDRILALQSRPITTL